MAFTAIITLTLAGADTGPFNLYSNLDGFLSPFETNVSKIDLEAGYSSVLVPDSTTTIRVQSSSVTCPNYVDLPISGITTTTSTSSTSTSSTTTTSTTAVPDPPTANLTFTSYEAGEFIFTLSAAIPSTNTVVQLASVDGSSGGTCTEKDTSDELSADLTILAGFTVGTQAGTTPLDCSSISYNRTNLVRVNGILRTNGQTLTIGGTLVTVVISGACVNPYIC